MAGSRPSGPAQRTKRPTIRDVAALAKVDPSLVSRIVNNDPRAASTPETRKRVLDAVDKLGYRASVTARALRHSRTMTVGLLLPDLSNPIYVSVVRGVEAAAKEAGYGVVIGSRVDRESEDELTRLLADGRVDGLIVASGTLHDDFLRTVATSGPGPIVLVNRHVDGVESSVTVDDAAGAGLATEHLIGLGHTVIAGLFGPADIDTTGRRKEGFRSAVLEAGCTPIELDGGSWSAEAGHRETLRLLDERPDVTAVFASTFLMGIGALRAAQDHGVQVPEDLSVVTLHDGELADYLVPSLTAVRMPSTEMGHEAFQLFHRVLDGGPAEHVVVNAEPVLIQRESSAQSVD